MTVHLTVGVPVHNALPYLREAMESLFAQEHRDFSILAIDDGSTDGSGEYLESIRDPRLRVVRQENRGLTATLNRLLEEAEGEWLVRHDADDVAYPGRLAAAAGAAARWPEAGMFYTRASYHQSGRSFGSFRTTLGTPEQLRRITRAGYLLSICHPTVILNVPRTRALGGYRRFEYSAEDVDLWWRMALAHDIRLIPQVTLGYRLNPNGVSSTRLGQQMVDTLYVQYLLLSELWGLRPLPRAEVAPRLAALVPQRRLRFRERVRRANVRMGEGRYLGAGGALLAALAGSPRDFLTRALYEFGRSGLAVWGEDPLRFVALEPPLWAE